MNNSKNPIAAAIGAAFLATAISPLASAEANPFSAQSLNGGYDLASYDHHAEGSCGGKAEGEGSCGGEKADGEGKCGEGKCGDSKSESEGSCGGKAEGEGSCGGDKAEGEGKCGEGKCGA